MISESKLCVNRPRENSSFEIELITEDIVDRLLVLFMSIVIRILSTGVEYRI
jgi:hypothetical protein